MIEPIPIKAGSKKVLLNGCPPKVDCRVISEENYAELMRAYHDMKDLRRALGIGG
jgi:hypothetical protein